ncbi:hypothetical protein [Actinomycetospora sp. TBRC 11914]|uniref:hypothetical protein n=1 Tax=Actinomycetospora sp. TBRC 11914 TaxID=2729387 RepID=UPI00145C91A1|nr:hypothetical protein [Actinomycetospora sp. TBRC 11914]NMO93056.1 hypothetical protein [Actinomycetospora sp. TBRC 11914]
MSDRNENRDQTATLVSHAAAWSADHEGMENTPPPPKDSPAERDLTTVERASALRSARYASQAYPGPVGDLITARIEEYVVDGRRHEPFDLAPRLVRAMQTMETWSPLPSRGGYDHLPAVPIPGSGMRWRYRTATDEDRD